MILDTMLYFMELNIYSGVTGVPQGSIIGKLVFVRYYTKHNGCFKKVSG